MLLTLPKDIYLMTFIQYEVMASWVTFQSGYLKTD